MRGFCGDNVFCINYVHCFLAKRCVFQKPNRKHTVFRFDCKKQSVDVREKCKFILLDTIAIFFRINPNTGKFLFRQEIIKSK